MGDARACMGFGEALSGSSQGGVHADGEALPLMPGRKLLDELRPMQPADIGAAYRLDLSHRCSAAEHTKLSWTWESGGRMVLLFFMRTMPASILGGISCR